MRKLNIGIYQTVITILIIIISSNCNANSIDSLKVSLENQEGAERLATLILLGDAYKKTDKNKSNNILKEAYSILSIDQPKQSADIAYQIAYNYKTMQHNDSASIYYNLALSSYKNLNDTLNIMKTSTMKGLSLQSMGEFGTSAKLFKNGIDLFAPYWIKHEGEPNISKIHLATMMSNYGISLYEIGQYDSALYYATEAFKIKKEAGVSSKQIAKALVNIGIVYLAVEKGAESISYFIDANKLFSQLNDSFNIRKCYNNIGMAYKQMGDTLLAIENYEKSREICMAINLKKGTATSLVNLSGLYAEMGKTKKAESMLKNALTIGNELHDKQLTSNALENLATLYFKSNKLKKALKYADSSNTVITQTEEMDIRAENNLLLSKIYEGLGNYNKSLQYHKLYLTLHDSLFNVDNTERFNRLQTEFETTKKEQKIILLTKDKENQLLENKILKNRQNTFIVVIILILILVAIVGFMIFLKRKKDGEIQIQKELFHKKENELAKSEIEKSKIKEEELQRSILYKSKQLSTHALHMMQKNTMLQEIQFDIKVLSKKAPIEDKPDFKRINQQINQSLRSQKDWDVFKLYFEDINKNFYQKLNEINPDLTTNDHRLCALIKLNMTSKEMASVLNVAPNSIKSSRYRLKKKLGLDVEADLEEFIKGRG